MQQMFVIGNLVHSPEMRMTPTGKTVANFDVATNSLNKSAPTEYFKIVAWDKLAELCKLYISKGKKVCVVGTAAVETWIGKDGAAKGKIVITAKQIEFLSAREDPASRGYSPHPEDLHAPWDDVPPATSNTASLDNATPLDTDQEISDDVKLPF